MGFHNKKCLQTSKHCVNQTGDGKLIPHQLMSAKNRRWKTLESTWEIHHKQGNLTNVNWDIYGILYPGDESGISMASSKMGSLTNPKQSFGMEFSTSLTREGSWKFQAGRLANTGHVDPLRSPNFFWVFTRLTAPDSLGSTAQLWWSTASI